MTESQEDHSSPSTIVSMGSSSTKLAGQESATSTTRQRRDPSARTERRTRRDPTTGRDGPGAHHFFSKESR